MKKKNRRKKSHRSWLLGRWMARLPSGCPLLYPIYLAAQLDTVEETLFSPALPPAFDGLRIAFFSDVHYGALLRKERVFALAERVNALGPDLVLMAGDYAENSTGAVEFFRMKPAFRARYAVLASLGNHDRTEPESNLPLLLDAMREDGVTPLVNDVWAMEKDGKKLAVGAIDDYYNGVPDYEKVCALCADADYTIFLPHTPDAIPKATENSEKAFYDLLLCGHTHGGQIAFFGHSIHPTSDLKDRYRSGWFHEKGADILVTNGVGASGLPVRLGTRPQLHLITLRSVRG